MPITSEAKSTWHGDLTTGSGTVALTSQHPNTYPINWTARSEGSTTTTTPEELIAAAHSACFSMAFSNAIAAEGFPATQIDVTAAVTFQPGKGLIGSHLLVSAQIDGISDADFKRLSDDAKNNCPVSQALSGISITIEAHLN